MSLTRERGAYIRGAYIRVEKRVTNLGRLYSRELIHGRGGLIYGILRYNIDVKMRLFYKKLRFKKKLMKHFSLGKCPLNTAVMG